MISDNTSTANLLRIVVIRVVCCGLGTPNLEISTHIWNLVFFVVGVPINFSFSLLLLKMAGTRDLKNSMNFQSHDIFYFYFYFL